MRVFFRDSYALWDGQNCLAMIQFCLRCDGRFRFSFPVDFEDQYNADTANYAQ
jgi:hypothetical protein